LTGIHSNLIVNDLIGELPVHCGYASYGCTHTGPYSELSAHMSTCASRPVQCPHHSFGCAWRGPQSALSAHVQRCVFEQLKEYLHKTEQQIALFKHTVEQQTLEINKLKRLLHEVSGIIAKNSVPWCIDTCQLDSATKARKSGT
jgi:hypothetical protein